MDQRFEAPALFGLILFLGAHYLVGYWLGYVLTHSILGAIAIALVTPCLSLFLYALVTRNKVRREGPGRPTAR